MEVPNLIALRMKNSNVANRGGFTPNGACTVSRIGVNQKTFLPIHEIQSTSNTSNGLALPLRRGWEHVKTANSIYSPKNPNEICSSNKKPDVSIYEKHKTKFSILNMLLIQKNATKEFFRKTYKTSC
jgi:hypothetical protein